VRCAGIDIGTNTLLLLIADISPTGEITTVADIQRTPRLGKDVDAERNIGLPAFQRIEKILIEFIANCRGHEVEVISAYATSAVRDARNREEFLAYQREKTGLKIEVLSGQEEAELTFKGAISGLHASPSNYAVLDIGGGSTEISFMEGDKLVRRSLQMGSVRITERFFLHQPPLPEEIEAARVFIQGELKSAGELQIKEKELVGVAGTVTSLSCFEQGLKEFDAHNVDDFVLSGGMVREWSEKLASLTSAEILSLSSVAEGRADILSAGALILAESMNHFQIEKIRASIRGLRYGIALKAGM
jgi:exopolyphosphatase/guanosine-5'-triphosphate,3'-diphosphate pyrophosphatase